jgi:hypothetical protein
MQRAGLEEQGQGRGQEQDWEQGRELGGLVPSAGRTAGWQRMEPWGCWPCGGQWRCWRA